MGLNQTSCLSKYIKASRKVILTYFRELEQDKAICKPRTLVVEDDISFNQFHALFLLIY
jgi:hypothetical protein